MPELPEVEAARRAVHENCEGKVISEVVVADDAKVIEGVSAAALQQALTGRKILGAHRKGKNLWLQLDQRPWPSFQFGMAGAFHIKGLKITTYKRSAVGEDEEWPSKYSKVFLKLDNGTEVSFTDKRRFARVRLLEDPTTTPPISELGPDALLELPMENSFVKSILQKKGSIKSLLLDQGFISGIGNWVADEVLYHARIHPEKLALNLSEEECKALHSSIEKVIKLSVDVDADSERFPEDWLFHYRWNKKPGKVQGKTIEFITVGGRTSAFVPELQKLGKAEGLKKEKPEALEDGVKKPSSKGRKAKESITTDEEEAVAPVKRVQKKTGEAKKNGTAVKSGDKRKKEVKKLPEEETSEDVDVTISTKLETGQQRSRAKKAAQDLNTSATLNQVSSELHEGKEKSSDKRRKKGKEDKLDAKDLNSDEELLSGNARGSEEKKRKRGAKV